MMQQLALIVEFETHPGKDAEFDTAIRAHARACLDEEPGCLRFEILRPLDDDGRPIPNRFMANELFSDQAALQAHRDTPRWQVLAEKFRILLANRRPILCDMGT
jgi:autoinducer 2-degrading protein